MGEKLQKVEFFSSRCPPTNVPIFGKCGGPFYITYSKKQDMGVPNDKYKKTYRIMTKEEATEWRPVVGYEDKYEVSTVGTVRSATSGKELAQWANNCGYLLTTLTAKGEGTNYLVHRLVA